MGSYVKYLLCGFNQKCSESTNDTSYEYTLTNNMPYKYAGHPFLESVYINDYITEITFSLLPEKDAIDYLEEINQELERVCFNLIAKSELPILQPCWSRELVVDKNGREVKINAQDTIHIMDDLCIMRTLSAPSIYECSQADNCLFTKRAQYQELFWILRSPYNVIRFMGLYDIMASLISNPISQKKVHDFFGKNKEKYPFISFLPSQKDPSKQEDCFTQLRNTIAHSKQVGVDKYVEVSKQISDTVIKRLLIVINDLLYAK